MICWRHNCFLWLRLLLLGNRHRQLCCAKLWCRQNGPDQKRCMALLFNADGDEFCDGSAAFTGTELRCPDVCHKPDGGNHAVFQRLSVHGCAVLFLSGGAACLPIQSVGNTWAPFAACVIELAARILCASVLSVPFGYRAVCFATPFAWLTALSLLIPVYIVLIRKLDGGQSTQTKT